MAVADLPGGGVTPIDTSEITARFSDILQLPLIEVPQRVCLWDRWVGNIDD